MARWLVTRNYATQELGPWQPGDEVELDDETAAHVQRDSPGALMPMEDAKKPDDAVEPEEPEERAVERPPADRMVRNPQRKRER